MNLGKPGKIALLILTILPIFYMFFFMAFIFITMVTTMSTNQAPSKDMFDFFPVLFIMHFAIILLSFGLIAFYIYYLFKTDRVEKDKKALWAVVLLLGSFFTMPVFWYLYIWREQKSVPANEPVHAQNASPGP